MKKAALSVEDQCPHCQAKNKFAEIDYGSLTLDYGQSVYYPAHCTVCGGDFREYYTLVFDGQYITEEGK